MSDFEFLEEDVFRIWRYFNEIDKDYVKYITIGQLFAYLNERNHSIISPYLERFFELIDREYIEKVSFEEFLPAVVSFCLFSKDEMITCKLCEFHSLVVFNMYDKDKDGEISKKDLFRVFKTVVENIQMFPINNMRAIELINLERGDKITKSEFITVVQTLPYTVFPAFRLQSQMKEMFGGYFFWNKCKKRFDKKEQERKMILEREKFFERTKKKKDLEYNDKLDFYEQKVRQMNLVYYAKQKKLRHRMAFVRQKGRRDSDGMIDVKMVHETFREEIDKLVEKRKAIREENPYEMPVMRDRMHYSFIWDRFTLFEADNQDDVIMIDPTDNRLDLQEEIKKLLKKKRTKKADTFTSSEDEAGNTGTNSNGPKNPQSNSN